MFLYILLYVFLSNANDATDLTKFAANWKNGSGLCVKPKDWKQLDKVCTWTGVACNSASAYVVKFAPPSSPCINVGGPLGMASIPRTVTHLQLEGFEFTGTIAWSKLPSKLAKLLLMRNAFSGTINWLALPSTLTQIALYANAFSGTVNWNDLNAKQITLLQLNDNALTGLVDLSNFSSSSIGSVSIQNNLFCDTARMGTNKEFCEYFLKTAWCMGNPYSKAIGTCDATGVMSSLSCPPCQVTLKPNTTDPPEPPETTWAPEPPDTTDPSAPPETTEAPTITDPPDTTTAPTTDPPVTTAAPTTVVPGTTATPTATTDPPATTTPSTDPAVTTAAPTTVVPGTTATPTATTDPPATTTPSTDPAVTSAAPTNTVDPGTTTPRTTTDPPATAAPTTDSPVTTEAPTTEPPRTTAIPTNTVGPGATATPTATTDPPATTTPSTDPPVTTVDPGTTISPRTTTIVPTQITTGTPTLTSPPPHVSVPPAPTSTSSSPPIPSTTTNQQSIIPTPTPTTIPSPTFLLPSPTPSKTPPPTFFNTPNPTESQKPIDTLISVTTQQTTDGMIAFSSSVTDPLVAGYIQSIVILKNCNKRDLTKLSWVHHPTQILVFPNEDQSKDGNGELDVALGIHYGALVMNCTIVITLFIVCLFISYRGVITSYPYLPTLQKVFCLICVIIHTFLFSGTTCGMAYVMTYGPVDNHFKLGNVVLYVVAYVLPYVGLLYLYGTKHTLVTSNPFFMTFSGRLYRKFQSKYWVYGNIQVLFCFIFSVIVGLVRVPCRNLIVAASTAQFISLVTMIFVRPHCIRKDSSYMILRLLDGSVDMAVEAIKMVLVNNSSLEEDSPQHLLGFVLQWLMVGVGVFKFARGATDAYAASRNQQQQQLKESFNVKKKGMDGDEEEEMLMTTTIQVPLLGAHDVDVHQQQQLQKQQQQNRVQNVTEQIHLDAFL